MFSGPNGAGKGDKPRMGISPREWAKRWEKIFRKDKKVKGKRSGTR